MKKIYFIGALLATALSFGQTTITQWNFDASNATPNVGTGTITLIGGPTAPVAPNDFPAGNPGTGKAMSSENYPAQGTNSGTAGFRIATSTVGYSGLSISFEQRGSNTGSRWSRYEYTADGTNWTALGNNGGAIINGWPASVVTVALPANADNNPNFAFRIVSIFSPNAFVENSVNMAANTAYEKINTTPTSTYNTTGTWRIDNVTLTGTTLGVKENNISGLKVYPNPAKNNLFVSSDSFAEKQVELYDVLGKVALKTKVTNAPINLSGLTSGVYVVKVTEEGKTATRKIVIE